ncbi:hypothetical protein DFH07DRAFT_777225 [Mycena maculata]|uniref:Uncharacterized protein n=1 Tax=Mycena maculata TaxID=230809 RepID=A0AAD7IIP7_9AGAR|nr:hypothetical protein DFH07DRAFT_777225 [Mycena maculata]
MSHSMGENAENLKVWHCAGMLDLGSQIPPGAAPEVLAISHVQFLDTDSEILGFDGNLPTSGLGLGDTGSFVIGPMLVMLVLPLVNYEHFHTLDLQGLFINSLPTRC